MKRNEILKEFKPGLAIAGTSIGASMLGGSLQSKLPIGVTNPLTKTGSTLGTFVGPIVTLGGLAVVKKQLKKTEKKLKGGKK